MNVKNWWYNKSIIIAMYFIITIMTISCTKEPGDGGTSSISGRVIVQNFNSTFTQLISEYPALDEEVYLVYGNNVGYDQRTRTDYNGYYRFSELRPGKYKIYSFSRDSTFTSPSGKTYKTLDIEITKYRQKIEATDIIIFK